MLLGFESRCGAAVREYAVISIKIGTGDSTSINTGTLVFELWPDLAPKTVQNFKHLANTRFYDATASHRLIPGFMIQAGDPYTRSDANVEFFGRGGPGHTIPDELAKQSDASWEKRKHVRGILSMAHSNTSERSNTGGSQFFVMLENASHLDGVHASFGTLTSGSEFLEKIEIEPTSENNQPTERISIQSVRVFGLDDASGPFQFKATTHSGLLRPADRSSINGRYQVSVLSTGAISGVIEYFARRASFAVSGSLPVVSGSLMRSNDVRMAVLTGSIDASSASPLLMDIVLQRAYSADSNENAISIELSTKTRVPLAYGFSESPAKSSKAALATQYTMLAQPSRVVSYLPANGWQNDTNSMAGYSSFLIRVNPSLGLSYVSGRMADGTPYTTSRMISSEHGANIFPLFSYTLPGDIEAQRTVFPNIDLSLWPNYMQSLTAAFTSGAVELSDKNSTTAALSNLLWIHPETTSTTAPLKNRSIVNAVTATAPWTPTTRNTVMKPFSSNSPRGQLRVNGTPFDFSLVRNTTAVFDQNASLAKPFLSFDPTTGAFSGIFNDTSTSPARRRAFSGVLLNSNNARGGFGHYLDSNSSKSIEILPIVP
jgi:peptidyl-prolyl cis-trans isomerase B (cyclophilin B)